MDFRKQRSRLFGLSSGALCAKATLLPAIVAVVVGLLASSCATPAKVPFTHLKYWNGKALAGYYYPVHRGDTLASIAKRFRCDLGFLAQLNATAPDRTLGAAERIFIPRTRTAFPQSYYVKPRVSDAVRASGSKQVQVAKADSRPPQAPTVVIVPANVSGQTRAANKSSASDESPLLSQPRSEAGKNAAVSAKSPKDTSRDAVEQPVPASSYRQRGIQIAQAYSKRRFPSSSQTTVPNAPRFQWPVAGRLSSTYNVRSSGRRLHLGIDIANKRGTPIRVAYAGRVIYSDNKYLPSMGNMILVEHAGGWITLYSHNERNLVKEGDYVEAGQTIATVGATGNATGPHLHFEIRKNAETPVDPLQYLPARS